MYEALKQVYKPHSVICFLNLFQIWQTLGLSFDHMIIIICITENVLENIRVCSWLVCDGRTGCL